MGTRSTSRVRTLGRYAVFLTLPTVLACSHATPVRAPAITQNPLPKVEPAPYRLQTGDLVAVRFWANPELDEEVLVRPDGLISLPFIDEIQAAGRTPAELDAELTSRFSNELTNPRITVILRSVSGNSVFVAGEVGGPTAVDLTGRMTLLQAITEADYFLPTSRRKEVLLIRTTQDGKRFARMIDVRPIISGENPEADIVLHPADIIVVPRSKISSMTDFLNRYFYDLLPIDLYVGYELVRD